MGRRPDRERGVLSPDPHEMHLFLLSSLLFSSRVLPSSNDRPSFRRTLRGESEDHGYPLRISAVTSLPSTGSRLLRRREWDWSCATTFPSSNVLPHRLACAPQGFFVFFSHGRSSITVCTSPSLRSHVRALSGALHTTVKQNILFVCWLVLWAQSATGVHLYVRGAWKRGVPPDHRKETQTAVVWTCLLFIRSGQNHLAKHSEYSERGGSGGEKTRQIEEEVGRQHQEMDRPGVRQVPKGSGEQRKMEETGGEVICGAPTTFAVKG